MQALNAWIQGNFKYAVILGIAGVVVGGLVAFKADNKYGYVVLGLGVALILYTMHVWGLF